LIEIGTLVKNTLRKQFLMLLENYYFKDLEGEFLIVKKKKNYEKKNKGLINTYVPIFYYFLLLDLRWEQTLFHLNLVVMEKKLEEESEVEVMKKYLWMKRFV